MRASPSWRAKVVLKPIQTFVSHNENRDLGWSLLCLGRVSVSDFTSVALLLSDYASWDLSFLTNLDIVMCSSVDMFRSSFVVSLISSKKWVEAESTFPSWSSWSSKWFLAVTRLGIIKKLKTEKANDIVKKALSISNLAYIDIVLWTFLGYIIMFLLERQQDALSLILEDTRERERESEWEREREIQACAGEREFAQSWLAGINRYQQWSSAFKTCSRVRWVCVLCCNSQEYNCLRCQEAARISVVGLRLAGTSRAGISAGAAVFCWAFHFPAQVETKLWLTLPLEKRDPNISKPHGNSSESSWVMKVWHSSLDEESSVRATVRGSQYGCDISKLTVTHPEYSLLATVCKTSWKWSVMVHACESRSRGLRISTQYRRAPNSLHSLKQTGNTSNL